jgi:hypothetical protein
MLMRTRKSQITMFVIMGLVLLIIVIITLTLINFLKPKPVNIDAIINELETGRIKNLVTNCITELSTDALDKLGSNGGAIYDYEGGTIPRISQFLGADYLNYTYQNKHYMVMYGLKKNTLCDQVNYSNSGYPFADKPFSELNTIYSSAETSCDFISLYSFYDGFFGQSVMKRLCYAIRDAGCENFAKGLELGLTIQKQLEDYVTSELPQCANFAPFIQRMPVTITPESEPIVETTIHHSDILVLVKYPVRIQFENQEPVKRILSYQTTLNVRLGLMYNFLFYVLAMDAKNIDFDKENQFTLSPYFRPGLNLKVISNPCSENCELPFKYDDIVEVTDSESYVKGKPFSFRVAVEDRRPALDFIPDQLIDVKDTNAINISLKAFDPDESRVQYAFFTYGVGKSQCHGIGDYVAPPEGGMVPGGKAVIPPVQTTAGAGWCENDSRINAALADSVLWAPITAHDSGNHRVGVLVKDESGLFSFRQFWINITDTTLIGNSVNQNDCLKPCIVYTCSDPINSGLCTCENASSWVAGDAFENHFNCEQSFTDLLTQPPFEECMNNWCLIAARQCSDVCPGGSFASEYNTEEDECWKCVDPIVHSAEPHADVDCSSFDQAGCIAAMPDCFWVLENVSNDFIGRCLDHNSLSRVQQPAYILTENV